LHGELKLVNWKSFGDFKAVRNVNLTVKDGEFVTLGPSGCGKTTTLRIDCRFYHPHRGSILLDDVPLHRLTKNLSAAEHAIWAWCSNRMPCASHEYFSKRGYPLRFKRISKQDMQEKVMHV
jgi:ABC-type sugar transport system ATPase subunit